MQIAVTGTPGVGKTSLAQHLAGAYSYPWVNEKSFAIKHNIGAWDPETNELEIPLPALEHAMNKHLSTHSNIIIEGHTLCELKLAVSCLIVLRLDPEQLEARLVQRGYRPEKIMDNVLCEGIAYCAKHAARNYPAQKIIEIYSQKTIAETVQVVKAALAAKVVV